MRQPFSAWPRRALMALVCGYRLLLSPWLGNRCRFAPTCSAYALEALDRHGAAAGSYLAVHRIARCHPFCAGGHDPVPPEAPALFRRFTTPPNPPARSSTSPHQQTSP
jgi:uncharacterized protein